MQIIHAETDDVMKLLDVFADQGEVNNFVRQFNISMDFIASISKAVPHAADEKVRRMSLASQLFAVTLFLQKNMEITNCLVGALKYTVKDEDAKDGSLRLPNIFDV